jgi:hypothetical protein
MGGQIRRCALAAGAICVAALALFSPPEPAPAAVPTAVSFTKATLAGESSSQVTSLQFGPDGRLYVGQQNGLIKAYGIVRHSASSYSVSSTETISALQGVPNHNDNGTPNTSLNTRLLTGILVTGTSANPAIYATTSDPRMGGVNGGDLNLDTNSGVVSLLSWSGSSWQRRDLVRGLPRSEADHATNGLVLDKQTNTLYVAQGGNTNKGAPSTNFALLPEYALSAAVLAIDLDAIPTGTYDLPTLEGAGDPFGGNDGLNQAKLVPGGPVQVHASGFRNPYDLALTSSGHLYTIDNGGNAGWGDVPVGEGPAGNCTNAPKESGTTDVDTLHLVTAGYYGGHPNPTRGNKQNTFNGQSPVSVAKPVECDYLAPTAREALATFTASTNGLAEYTASNFGGAMKGDLLAASFNNSIYHIDLGGAGTSANASVLFGSVGSIPLDVTAQGDGGPFPGTIWAGDVGNGSVTVFEPSDFVVCTGADNWTLDEDKDGYKNADEIDNETNPCSAADLPPDWDADFLSNLNDPDDDNDGQSDTSDPFAIDAANGTSTFVPFAYGWENDAPRPGGLLDLGFSGLMTNGLSNYESLFDPTQVTPGGAAGVFTIDSVPEGDALGPANSQMYGLQIGVHTPGTPFTVHTRVVTPFAGLTPQSGQSIGLFAGTGDQDNYVKFVVVSGSGAGGVELVREIAGTPNTTAENAPGLLGAESVDLFLLFDPVSASVRPSYEITKNGVTQPRVWLSAQPVPSSWLTSVVAVGVIATSAGPGPPFPASWDLIEVFAGDGGVPPPQPPSPPPPASPAPPALQLPPSPPPTVRSVRAGLAAFAFTTVPQRPRAGRMLTASLGVRRLDTGATLRSGTIRCSARIGRRPLRLAAKAFRRGRALCTWRIPNWARSRVIRGSVAVRQGTFEVERRFSKPVRR